MKQCPKCYGFHAVGAACQKRPKLGTLATQLLQGVKEAKAIARGGKAPHVTVIDDAGKRHDFKNVTIAEARRKAASKPISLTEEDKRLMTLMAKSIPNYADGCLSCELRRLKNLIAVRKGRRK
jgi:hypothetical protein